jgi:hypothetical protein
MRVSGWDVGNGMVLVGNSCIPKAEYEAMCEAERKGQLESQQRARLERLKIIEGMDEATYQGLLARAKKLLAEINQFPHREFGMYQTEYHPEDENISMRMWAAYVEGAQ